MKPLPSVARLRELLECDPDTGELTWLVTRGPRAKAGSSAGTVNKAGYRQVVIDGRFCYAHRLVWALTAGEWPSADLEIDHIDRDKTNNRAANLRLVDHRANNINKVPRKRDLPRGVVHSVNCKDKPYRAQIMSKRHQYNLGEFATVDEASAAYVAAKARMHVINGQTLTQSIQGA